MAFVKTDKRTDFVKIEMKDGKSFVVQLDDKNAPVSAENFRNLVEKKFYDGIIFHRVIAGFVIQGGDPTGTGMGGSDTTIKGEFRANGVNNTLSHKRGVLSMARSQLYDSASSQFFVCHKDALFLDGQYAAFGFVVEGMETVDAVAAVETGRNDRPTVPQVMQSVYFVERA